MGADAHALTPVSLEWVTETLNGPGRRLAVGARLDEGRGWTADDFRREREWIDAQAAEEPGFDASGEPLR